MGFVIFYSNRFEKLYIMHNNGRGFLRTATPVFPPPDGGFFF